MAKKKYIKIIQKRLIDEYDEYSDIELDDLEEDILYIAS